MGSNHSTNHSEGLKILDPTIQAFALISKLVVRGLKPGWEPWMTFVRFHVYQAKYIGYGHWLHHRHWSIHAKAAQTAQLNYGDIRSKPGLWCEQV